MRSKCSITRLCIGLIASIWTTIRSPGANNGKGTINRLIGVAYDLQIIHREPIFQSISPHEFRRFTQITLPRISVVHDKMVIDLGQCRAKHLDTFIQSITGPMYNRDFLRFGDVWLCTCNSLHRWDVVSVIQENFEGNKIDDVHPSWILRSTWVECADAISNHINGNARSVQDR